MQLTSPKVMDFPAASKSGCCESRRQECCKNDSFKLHLERYLIYFSLDKRVSEKRIESEICFRRWKMFELK